MKTEFSAERLNDPRIGEADAILRNCVHCGFCNAACPTYAVTGDERDGPRGRIWLMRDLLQSDAAPAAEAIFHLDRCVECVACMPACPSGVDYRHLLAIARDDIATRGHRPAGERLLRAFLAKVLTVGARLKAVAALARPFAVFAPLLPRRLGGLLRLAARLPRGRRPPSKVALAGPRKGRVAVLAGCAQGALAPGIDAAFARLLARAGIEAVTLRGAACCGALDAHLGRADAARAKARAVIAAVEAARADGALLAVVQTSSGCGAMLKDYAHLLRDDRDWAARAAAVATLARDPSEVLDGLDLAFAAPPPVSVAWQAPCSLANAQRAAAPPLALLRRAGFRVLEPADGGQCCGAGGVYNALEPDLAGELRARKRAALDALGADVVVSSNFGCMVQLAGGPPVVHVLDMLDWAAGGPPPAGLGAPCKR